MARVTVHARGMASRRALLAPAALLLLSAVPSLAPAQARRAPAREESPFEQEVERLVQELLQRKRASMALIGNLQELQLAIRAPGIADETRAQGEASLRQLRMRLASLESDGARIQRRLSDICAADRKPQGWVGIYYSASASANRDEAGRVVMRFVDYPGIESVEPGSPADKAGLRGGDRIVSMAGRDLRDAEIDFTPLLKPGTRVRFKVRRGMETKTFTVTIEPRPDDFSTPCPWIDERIAAALSPLHMRMLVTTEEPTDVPGGTRVIVQRVAPVAPAPPNAVSPVAPVAPAPPLPPVGVMGRTSTIVFGGAQFVEVGPELADALGVERGLLVVNAGRGSPAEQSGLRAGDVLLAVEGEPLTSPFVFLQAVEASEGRELRVQLLRRRKPATVTLRW